MKRILVIEDNETNLYLMRFLLENNGFSVMEAKTGFQGVAVAEKENFDLILMDIQLPDIDGLEATRKIRASGTRAAVPILAVTSYAMVGDREKALTAGCTGYIEKPIDPVTFISEIKKYIQLDGSQLV